MPPNTANPAIASQLQSLRPVRRVADLYLLSIILQIKT